MKNLKLLLPTENLRIQILEAAGVSWFSSPSATYCFSSFATPTLHPPTFLATCFHLRHLSTCKPWSWYNDILLNGRGNSLRWQHNTLYPQKLALTSPTSGSRSAGIVRLRTKATEFSFFYVVIFTMKGIISLAKNEYFCLLLTRTTVTSNPGWNSAFEVFGTRTYDQLKAIWAWSRPVVSM
jgi:hypothetical protein